MESGSVFLVRAAANNPTCCVSPLYSNCVSNDVATQRSYSGSVVQHACFLIRESCRMSDD